MKTNILIKIILLLFCTVLIKISDAQHFKKNPPGFQFKSENTPEMVVEDISTDELQNKIAISKENKQALIAIGKQISKNFKTFAHMKKMPDGVILQMKINSKKASAIALSFNRFNLAPHAEFYIYNEDHSLSAGPFTSVDVDDINNFATLPLAGNKIILELYEPNTISFESEINISAVSLVDEKLALNAQTILQTTGSDISINCYQGSA